MEDETPWDDTPAGGKAGERGSGRERGGGGRGREWKREKERKRMSVVTAT